MLNQINRQRQRDIEQDEQARVQGIVDAWLAYDGQHPKPLRIKPNKADNNVIVNLCRLIVDVNAAFLFGGPGTGTELRFATDTDDEAMTDEELWLERVWAENKKLSTLYKLAITLVVLISTFERQWISFFWAGERVAWPKRPLARLRTRSVSG